MPPRTGLTVEPYCDRHERTRMRKGRNDGLFELRSPTIPRGDIRQSKRVRLYVRSDKPFKRNPISEHIDRLRRPPNRCFDVAQLRRGRDPEVFEQVLLVVILLLQTVPAQQA